MVFDWLMVHNKRLLGLNTNQTLGLFVWSCIEIGISQMGTE